MYVSFYHHWEISKMKQSCRSSSQRPQISTTWRRRRLAQKDCRNSWWSFVADISCLNWGRQEALWEGRFWSREGGCTRLGGDGRDDTRKRDIYSKLSSVTVILETNKRSTWYETQERLHKRLMSRAIATQLSYSLQECSYLSIIGSTRIL